MYSIPMIKNQHLLGQITISAVTSIDSCHIDLVFHPVTLPFPNSYPSIPSLKEESQKYSLLPGINSKRIPITSCTSRFITLKHYGEKLGIATLYTRTRKRLLFSFLSCIITLRYMVPISEHISLIAYNYGFLHKETPLVYSCQLCLTCGTAIVYILNVQKGFFQII